MSEPVSGAEFARTVSMLQSSIDKGFSGVNARLDQINGKVNRHGEHIAVLVRDVAALRSEDDAQDVAIEEISGEYNRLETLLKVTSKEGTTEALQERVPSKKVAFSALAVGGGVADLLWRIVLWKTGG